MEDVDGRGAGPVGRERQVFSRSRHGHLSAGRLDAERERCSHSHDSFLLLLLHTAPAAEAESPRVPEAEEEVLSAIEEHVLLQRVTAGEVALRHVGTEHMAADFLTKWLPKRKLDACVRYATNAWAHAST